MASEQSPRTKRRPLNRTAPSGQPGEYLLEAVAPTVRQHHCKTAPRMVRHFSEDRFGNLIGTTGLERVFCAEPRPFGLRVEQVAGYLGASTRWRMLSTTGVVMVMMVSS